MNDQQQAANLDASTLRQWLEEKREVLVLDVRPLDQRQEWAIPGSIHADVYEELKAGGPADLAHLNLPKDTPIVTVCAAGRVSLVAARQLASEGYQVYSLHGGMKAWSSAWNVAALWLTEQASVLQVRRTGKGCLSYLVGSEGQALVIDPSVDAEVYGQLASQNGWQIKYVVETHLHADHLSRAHALASQTGATLILPLGDERQYSFQPIRSGESLSVGSLSLQALATPGHTHYSFSYYLKEGVLFTGDTLFTRGVGRPDLHSHWQESSVRAALLHESLQKLLAFPDETLVLPGHTSQPVAFDGQLIASRIGELKSGLAVLTLPVGEFIQQILSRIPATPGNYTTITERNATGDFSESDSLDLEAGANRCAVS